MTRRRTAPMLPKVCGGDLELGNFVAGVERFGGTGPEAARVLLRGFAEVTGGVPASAAPGWRHFAPPLWRAGRDRDRGLWENPQDSGRIFLPANGGSAYIDLDHLELCLPEVVSAFDHVAAWHAMLRLAQAALARANADRPPDRRIAALVNNSDGRGNSYGGHLNLLLSRRAWESIMQRRLHYLAYLASYQASSIVFTGQGKVGSENDAPPAAYQLSQRADFIETLLGPQTTYFRPLVNSRDEPHSEQARLHLISFDSTLAPAACLLRVGVTQLVLGMIEAERVKSRLALEEPLAALHGWSHDPSLTVRARLVTGKRVTAVEHQRLLLAEARAFAARGTGFAEWVPRAGEILDLWEDTLDRLARSDWPSLTRRLDWVLKLAMLERTRAQHGLDWSAPELRYLDQLYGSLDPTEGLFWAWARAGLLEPVIPEERIRHFTETPPEDTRAFARAMLLRAAGPEAVEQVDWGELQVRLDGTGRRRVSMPNPHSLTRTEWEQRVGTGTMSLDEILAALGAEPPSQPAANPSSRQAVHPSGCRALAARPSVTQDIGGTHEPA
ncbi:MAG: proteasome accessory factor PafA2 family protein [Gemmatimonadales bacterium]